MPLLWERVVGVRARPRGSRPGECHWQGPDGVACIECLHAAEKGDRLTHPTWADHFVLIAKTPEDLEAMANEFHRTIQSHGLRLSNKLHLSSSSRGKSKVAGRWLPVEDLAVLGLSAVAGGPPE